MAAGGFTMNMLLRLPMSALVRMLLVAALGSGALLAQAHGLSAEKGLRISTTQYSVPPLWLIRDDGRKVLLAQELDDGRPVLVNFIYTTCTGICPLLSQVFSEFQSRLGDQREKVHMVSISIDPEQDTPARLRAYAQRFSAGSQWRHYTGTLAASIAAQKAFGAYGGDKMNHSALTLLRAAPGKPWVRMDGFASPQDLMDQYLKVTAMSAPADAAP
jgi:protein SCO1/2